MKKTKKVNTNEIDINLNEINIIADAMMEKKAGMSPRSEEHNTAFTDHL